MTENRPICDGVLECGCACQGVKTHLPGPHFIYKTGHTCERSWEQLLKKHQWLMDIQPEGNPHAFPRWGFECGLGWYFIIDKALTQYKAVYEATGSYPIIDQIKEKFGTMRFYVGITPATKVDDSSWGDVGFMISDNAERKSATTCEVCGGNGSLRGDSWYYTACDEHDKEKK